MRDDQICERCEWWDDRQRGDDPSAADQMPCLRWREHDLWTSAEARCWQWTLKEELRPKMVKEDVEEAVLNPKPGGIYRAIRMGKPVEK